MKTRLLRLSALLVLTSAVLAGCSGSEPDPVPVPEPYYPGQEAVTPVPEIPPAEPVAPDPVEETEPTLLERLDLAYIYTNPDSGEEHYIEFTTLNGCLMAEVAVRAETGSRFSYWMAELSPVDDGGLNNREGEPCLLRSREFSGFSFEGAYWGPEEVVSLTVARDALMYRRGEDAYLLEPAREVDKLHDETEMCLLLQMVEEPVLDSAALAVSGIPGVREAVVNQGDSLYLELEESGLFWLMRKNPDTPTQLYRGAYGVSADGNAIHYCAQRLGYNTMPYFGKWEISREADGVLCLNDETGEIQLSTDSGSTVKFYPTGAEIPAEHDSRTMFTYNGTQYDVTQYAPAVNAIMDIHTVGRHMVVEGHVGPKNGVYLIFNTETEEFEQVLSGNNLIWHSDDIHTAVYAFWGDIYTYDETLIGSVTENSPENSYVRELSFSSDQKSVHVQVGTPDGEDRNVTFPIP